jgi:hypothetical protein
VLNLKTFTGDTYDFDRAVTEFEQNVRLVDFFQYAFTASELERVMASFKESASKIAPEDRTQAAKLSDALVEVFRRRPDGYVRDFLQKLSDLRRSFLFMSDIHQKFKGDSAGFGQFMANAIAIHTPKEGNLQLETLIPLLDSILNLVDRLRNSSVSDETAASAREAEFRDAITRVASQGLSFEMMKRIASMFGFLGGQPGRPLKDYDAEYEFWITGKKWREVAEFNLQNDSDTREEFGGRTFGELSAQQQRTLVHRVRIGVGAFAKRTGKSTARNKLLPRQEEEQQIPS